MRRSALAFAAAGVLALTAAPAARADVRYGGSGLDGSRVTGPLTVLTRHDDGRITVRVVSGYGCRKASYVNEPVRLTGATADGVNFTAAGRTKLNGRAVRYTLRGTLAPESVTGTLLEQRRGCRTVRLNVNLRVAAAPAGAPAVPAAGAYFAGLTSQSAGSVGAAVALKITRAGKVYGAWSAAMRCGRSTFAMSNAQPATTIRADGTFTRRETYTVRYRGGARERFRVTFSGRFLADGATGTLRGRSTYRSRRGTQHCDTGTQTWTARP